MGCIVIARKRSWDETSLLIEIYVHPTALFRGIVWLQFCRPLGDSTFGLARIAWQQRREIGVKASSHRGAALGAR
jgi:hypothetical protein